MNMRVCMCMYVHSYIPLQVRTYGRNKISTFCLQSTYLDLVLA